MARSTIRGSRNSISRDARQAFQIEGLGEIVDKLAAIVDAPTAREAKEVYYEGGKILADQARANAPYDPDRKKGTHLRDAIFVTRGDESKPDVLVGVRYNQPRGAPHGHLLEYGTAKMKAQPFFRPAMTQTGRVIASTIKTGLLRVIEKSAAKK
jgi:HK97 gp10 family phage protein